MAGGYGNIKPEDGVQFGNGNKAAEKWKETDALRLGEDLLSWMKEKDENVFFDDFLYLACDESKYKGKIYPDLLSYLAKKYTSFSELLVKCREIEKIKLKKFGAFDKLNSGIVKFLLSAEYGLSERQKTVNQNTNTNITLTPEEREARINELKSKLNDQ